MVSLAKWLIQLALGLYVVINFFFGGDEYGILRGSKIQTTIALLKYFFYKNWLLATFKRHGIGLKFKIENSCVPQYIYEIGPIEEGSILNLNLAM